MYADSTIVVRYAETDQMGIAHHSVYPVWYEVARTDLIQKLGMHYSEMEEKGVILPLTDMESHYHQAAKYEDRLTVRARVEKMSAARIRFSYEVFRDGEETPINTGATAHGFVDSHTFEPINLRKKYPQLYALLAKAMEEETCR